MSSKFLGLSMIVFACVCLDNRKFYEHAFPGAGRSNPFKLLWPK